MSSRLFVDTSFIVASVNWRDQYHERATLAAKHYGDLPLLVTDAVLLEVGNALARDYKAASVQIMERFLSSDGVEVVHLDPLLFARAFDLYKSYQDKAWGLVDCISFTVMREAGITAALTFDHHFEQAGFQVLMRENNGK